MQPKRESANNDTLDPIFIPPEYTFDEPKINEAVDRIRTATEVTEVQNILRNLLGTSDENVADVAKVLAYLFITVDSKYTIRKTISRILNTLPVEIVQEQFIEFIDRTLVDIQDKGDGFQSHNDFAFGLSHLFNNFPIGIDIVSLHIDVVTRFGINYFYDIVGRLKHEPSISDLHVYTHNIAKLLVAILQQTSRFADCLPELCTKLLISSYKCIMDKLVSFDCKSNSGVLMVFSVIHTPNHDPDDLILNDEYASRFCKLYALFKEFNGSPSLSLLGFDQFGDENEVGNEHKCRESSQSYTANLCIYAGILNVVPHNLLCVEVIDDVPVISFMLRKLLGCAKRCTGMPKQISEVSRCLIVISKVIHLIPLNFMEPLFSEGLDFVWTHLDHYMESVKQSAKNVLENLIRVAYDHHKTGFESLLKVVLTNMIDLLVNRCTHYCALTILSAETSCSFLLNHFAHLPFILLVNMQNSASAPQICTTYESLMAQHIVELNDIDQWLTLWVDPIKSMLSRSMQPTTPYYQRLIVAAYKIQPLVLQSIMHYQWCAGSNELGALLGCLREARRFGHSVPLPIVSEISGEDIDLDQYWRGIIEYEFLDLMMCHQNDEVRVHILALLVESHKSREIFMQWELDFIKRFFHYNITTQTASTRQQLLGLYKKVFIRVRDSLAVINRNIAQLAKKLRVVQDRERLRLLSADIHMLKEHDIDNRQFAAAMFQDAVCPGFEVSNSYSRRTTCLELLQFILAERCIEEDEIVRMWRMENTTAILRVLCDSYESNATVAFNIISLLPKQIFEELQEGSPGMVLINFESTLRSAQDIKASTTMSAAYGLQIFLRLPKAKETLKRYLSPVTHYGDVYSMAVVILLDRAKASVEFAKVDLLTASENKSFYGYLTCVKSIIEANNLKDSQHWGYIANEIVLLCETIICVCAPVVNSASPEGYLPEDLNELPLVTTSTSQRLVTYAWRSVKEVTLLLGVLSSHAPVLDPVSKEQLLTTQLLQKMKQIYTKIILESKHRGVFEQCYVGFSKFTEFLWCRTTDPKLSKYPTNMMNRMFEVLSGSDRAALSNLCKNRRSAGLPLMMLGIVTSEPLHTNNHHFHQCMRGLIKITNTEASAEAHIHTVNILRTFYRHRKFGELVTPYVANGVAIALRMFGSDDYATKNAGMMLTASLIQRIFGVQRSKDLEVISNKNKMSTRVFFMRYKELYDCFLYYLKDGTVNKNNISVLYPVLLILERLYPCNTEEETQLGEYIPYITKCLQLPIYNIRELAAQACASLIPNLEVVNYIAELLVRLSDYTLTDNYCQGTIAQITCLLKSLNRGHSSIPLLGELIQNTFWIPISAGRYTSHYTVANYYDMMTLLTTVFSKDCMDCNVLKQFVKILIWQSLKECGATKIFSTARKKMELARLNLHVHIVQNLYFCDHFFKSVYLKELILQSLHSRHEEIIQYALNYVNYMYLDHPRFLDNSLYVTNEIDMYAGMEGSMIYTMDMTLKQYAMETIHYKIDHWLERTIQDILTKSNDVVLSLFLALQYFPCVMQSCMKNTRQGTLDFLLSWCKLEHDHLFCAVLSCISNFFYIFNDEEMLAFNCNPLYGLLSRGAQPSSPAHVRCAVAQFLVQNRRLYTQREFFSDSGDSVKELWRAVVLLLDDDSYIVRNTICQLAPKIKTYKIHQNMSLRFDSDVLVISDRAKEEILEACIRILPTRISIPLFLGWVLKPLDAPAKSQKQLFDTGVENTFYEAKQFEKLTMHWFKKLLWRLEGGLNYDDKSVFIEEMVLMVATMLYNSLLNRSPRMVDPSVIMTVLCIVKKIKKFAEDGQLNTTGYVQQLHSLIEKECQSQGGSNHRKLFNIVLSIFTVESGDQY